VRPCGAAAPSEFRYQLPLHGRFVRVSGRFVLPPGGEMPLWSDSLVLLALLQRTLAHGAREPLVRFARGELLALLGWQDGGGPAYERLAQALRRYQGLQFVLDSQLASRAGALYTGLDRATRLIERYEIGDGRPAPCRVRWGPLVSEALRLDDVKRLDWGLVSDLGSALAVQLYRFLDRVALDGSRTLTFGWRTLATVLGVRAGAYARPGRFRAFLAPHAARLVACGALASVGYERGGRFVFQLGQGRDAASLADPRTGRATAPVAMGA
jgi:hypothetical protein